MTVIDSTFGVFFIGVVFSGVLYGVTCVQTWYYFTGYPSDPWYLKLLVSATFVSDTIHQALISHASYTDLITYFGIFSSTTKISWSPFIALLFNGFTAAMVQCFLIMRIYKLSKKYRLVITASALSLVIGGFVSVVLGTIKGLGLADFAELDEFQVYTISINAFAAAADILIAGFLCMLLLQARTGFKKTNTMIKKMIFFSINTGLLTSVCAIMSLISVIVWPTAFVYVAFYFSIGRLYCNSLLATLNARMDIRGDSSDEVSTALSLQQIPKNIITPMRALPNNNITIEVDTKREYFGDGESILSASDLQCDRV